MQSTTYEASLSQYLRLDKGKPCGRGFINERFKCKAGFSLKQSAPIQYKEHQTRIADKLKTQRGLIVDHGLGSGKTLSAINAAEQYGGAVVITPASLRNNFRKELAKAGAKGEYDIYSYEEFTRNPPSLKGRMLIADEAHRLRNSETQRTRTVLEAGKDAEKVLLLTATPLQNHPHEIATLINLTAGEDVFPVSQKAFEARYIKKKIIQPPWHERLLFGAQARVVKEPKNLDEFKKKAGKYVDHHAPSSEDYPSVERKTVEIPMTEEQRNAHNYWTKKLDPVTRMKIKYDLPLDKRESNNLNNFITAQRQVSNTPKAYQSGQAESPKVKAIADRVQTSKGPVLVYSNYLGSGVEELESEFKKRKIKSRIFTGSTPEKEKKQIVEDYNSGKMKALIVSSSGGEGLDLKKTRQVHIMEPHWNEEKVNQVIGRAARFQSHKNLPPEDRNVDVYKYVSVIPGSKEKTADQYLSELGSTKRDLNAQFLKALRL